MPAKLAVEHRTAGNHDGREIATGSTHQQRRSGLIAACKQHNSINGIGANRLFHIHADKVAKHHGGRAHQSFAKRHHRELEWETPSLVNSALHVIGNAAEVRIAGRKFRPGVADADDRPAIEQVIRQPLVLHPAAVDKTVPVSQAKPS